MLAFLHFMLWESCNRVAGPAKRRRRSKVLQHSGPETVRPRPNFAVWSILVFIEWLFIRKTASNSPQPLFRAARKLSLHGGIALDMDLDIQKESDLLSQENAFLRQIIDNSTVVVFVKDIDGRYIFVNHQYSQLLNSTPEQLIGQVSYDFFPAPLAQKLKESDQRVLASGETFKFEEVIPLNGENRTFITLRFPLRNADGAPIAVCGIATDITDRKKTEQALAISEARFRLISAASFEGIAITKDGCYIDFNDQLLKMLGYSREQMTNLPVAQTIGEADVDTVVNKLRTGVESNYEISMRRQDGTLIRVEAHGKQVPHGDEKIRVTALRDVTQQRQAEESLRIAATAFESQEGILITDADGKILRVNSAFSRITGYAAEEAIGQNTSLLKSGRHGAEFYAAMWQAISEHDTWQGEVWNRRKNGEAYPEWLTISTVRDAAGEITHFVGTITDITLRKAAEEEANFLAFFDPLTSLPNRRLLVDRLEHAVATSNRHQRTGAVLFIDLDNFKSLNDTRGHHVGDQLLKQVGERITCCLREDDTLARFGGDEFVVLLEELGPDKAASAAHAETVCKKILDQFNRPFQLQNCRHRAGASVGATLFHDRTYTTAELMKQADLAMYQAKEAGKNTFRFFDPTMQAQASHRAALEADLRDAIEQHEFVLHYQAQVDIHGNTIGAEALVRWQHPERGLIPPVEFIPLAEETGNVVPLGDWVLETACKQLVCWGSRPRTAHLTLSVNVSAEQFRHASFVDHVLETLARTGANPKRLKLELTETLLADDIHIITKKMNLLKARGINFSLDDFGTGYSSMLYLKSLPLKQLKIDKYFVQDVIDDPYSAAIAQMILAFANTTGLDVVAEGVERWDQQQFLVEHGCQHFQGYLFGKPMPIDQFQQLHIGIYTD